MNKLYFNDNIEVLKYLISEKIEVDLVYIDPPYGILLDKKFNMDSWKNFKINSNFDYLTTKLFSHLSIEDLNYLCFIEERLVYLHKIIKSEGSIFLHIDCTFGHYVKILLDIIFGKDNFMNEIIWGYGAGSSPKKYFPRKHDSIYFYAKNSDKNFFNKEGRILRVPYDQSTLDTHYKKIDEDGRRYRVQTVNGREYKTYADVGKFVTDVWTDIGAQTATSPISKESTGYPTQKPEKLLERIIHASCPENGIVMDVFAGSGTVGKVAMKLNRKFILCDKNEYSINTIEKRLNIKREVL